MTNLSHINNLNIAVLLTCFNRKEKTLKCLESIFSQNGLDGMTLEVFLVDDGSSDGTSQAVNEKFPQVKIVVGDGNLFWAGGMRLAWKTAMQSDKFDYFWLVNDDTIFYENTLLNLLKADEYALMKFGEQGIYSGSTLDPVTGLHSYGGERLISKDNYATEPVYPDGTYQSCDFTNANILLVSESVVGKLGIFSEKYVHSIADYDYSMRATKEGLPVLVLPEYAGECVNDHLSFLQVTKTPLKKRIRNLYSPKGYSYQEFLYFVKTFFLKRYLNTVITLWIRTLFPGWWSRYKRLD
jgi:GT2 family glycosyltransferase